MTDKEKTITTTGRPSLTDIFNQASLATAEPQSRSYWIPGSWHLRMVYTHAIPFHDPSQESTREG
jgi:hypothetical protein